VKNIIEYFKFILTLKVSSGFASDEWFYSKASDERVPFEAIPRNLMNFLNVSIPCISGRQENYFIF
jgi:hypothetical protein